jgi:hypothetical protein
MGKLDMQYRLLTDSANVLKFIEKDAKR